MGFRYQEEGWFSTSVAETTRLASEFARTLREGDIVLFRGELGVGKTAFIRGLARELGVPDEVEVSSPSYSLVNVYALDDGRGGSGAVELVHIDLYRVEGDDALYGLGFEDLLEEAIVCVEWPERAPILETWASHVWEIEIERDGRRLRLLRHPESRLLL